MLKILFIILVFVMSISAQSGCCLSFKIDSLITEAKKVDNKSPAHLDSAWSKNTFCDSFKVLATDQRLLGGSTYNVDNHRWTVKKINNNTQYSITHYIYYCRFSSPQTPPSCSGTNIAPWIYPMPSPCPDVFIETAVPSQRVNDQLVPISVYDIMGRM